MNWTGGARDADWGTLLRRDRTTIYVRHQGPGFDRWDKPDVAAVVVLLPPKFDAKAAHDDVDITSARERGAQVGQQLRVRGCVAAHVAGHVSGPAILLGLGERQDVAREHYVRVG